jgi:membrane-bound lytic murein transglycosylase A
MFHKNYLQIRFLLFTLISLLSFSTGCAGWRDTSQIDHSYNRKTFKSDSGSRKRKNFENWSPALEDKIDPKSYGKSAGPKILDFSSVQKKHPYINSSDLILPLPQTIAPATTKNFDDDLRNEGLSVAIRNHLDVLDYQDPNKMLPMGGRQIPVRRITSTLRAFLDLINQELSTEEFARQIEDKFEFIRTGKGSNLEALFTGYYTPVIPASKTQSSEFNFPIYKKPYQLSKNRLFVRHRTPGKSYATLKFIDGPNYTREDIDGFNALQDSGLEIAWLQDEMERYFLHIQGSGILEFPNGERQGVQFAGTNGYRYKSVGKHMLETGALNPSQGSMQGIKKHFNERPQDIPKYLYKNKRYIFFEFSDGTPRGSSGTPVIANRSIATDTSIYPQGGLAFISSQKPVLDSSGEIAKWEPFTRFVLNQDTGSAIKGLGRVDLYFGIGKRAGQLAGRYMQKGNLYFLLLKDKPMEFSKNSKTIIPVR